MSRPRAASAGSASTAGSGGLRHTPQQLLSREGRDARNVLLWRVPNEPRHAQPRAASGGHQPRPNAWAPGGAASRRRSAGGRGRGRGGAMAGRGGRRSVGGGRGHRKSTSDGDARAKRPPTALRSPGSAPAIDKQRLRTTLWSLLMYNVARASDELYSLAEFLSDPGMVSDAISTLNNAVTDFQALAARLEMQAQLERDSSGDGSTGHRGGAKRRAMAWDVRTTSPARPRLAVLDVLQKYENYERMAKGGSLAGAGAHVPSAPHAARRAAPQARGGAVAAGGGAQRPRTQSTTSNGSSKGKAPPAPVPRPRLDSGTFLPPSSTWAKRGTDAGDGTATPASAAASDDAAARAASPATAAPNASSPAAGGIAVSGARVRVASTGRSSSPAQADSGAGAGAAARGAKAAALRARAGVAVDTAGARTAATASKDVTMSPMAVSGASKAASRADARAVAVAVDAAAPAAAAPSAKGAVAGTPASTATNTSASTSKRGGLSVKTASSPVGDGPSPSPIGSSDGHLADSDAALSPYSSDSVTMLFRSPVQGLWADLIEEEAHALRSPPRVSPSGEAGRVLHKKLSSPERRRPSPLETKRRQEERQMAAMDNRRRRDMEMQERLRRLSNRVRTVTERNAQRKLQQEREMLQRLKDADARHEAHLKAIVRKAESENMKVDEVGFINQIQHENKKMILQQRLEATEARRQEHLAKIRYSAKENDALARRKSREEESKATKGRSPRGGRGTPSPRRPSPRTPPSKLHRRSASGGARTTPSRTRSLWDDQPSPPSSAAFGSLAAAAPGAPKSPVAAVSAADGVAVGGVMLADPPHRRSTATDSPLLAGTSRLHAARSPSSPPRTRHPDAAPAAAGSPSSAGNGAGSGAGAGAAGTASPPRSGGRASSSGAGAAISVAASNSRAKRERDKSRKKKARKQRQTMSSMAASPEFAAALAAVEARDADNLGAGSGADAVDDADAGGDAEVVAGAGGDAGPSAGGDAGVDGAGGTTVASSSVRLVQLVAELKRNIPSGASGAAAVLTGVVEGKLRELARLLEAKGDSARASTRNCVYLRVSGGLRTVVQCCTREAVAFSPRIVSYALRAVSAALATTASNRSYVLLANLGVPLVDVLASALDQVISAKDIDALISQASVDVSLLSAAMHTLWIVLRHEPQSLQERSMRSAVTRYCVLSAAVSKLTRFFALIRDSPALVSAGALLHKSLAFLESLTALDEARNKPVYQAARLSPLVAKAMKDNGLGGLLALLLSLLMAVAPPTREQSPPTLPQHTLMTTILVLKVLNNTARLDLGLVQQALADPGLNMEFHHVLEYLLGYISSKVGVASPPQGTEEMLGETILAIGYVSLQCPPNQERLHWGKSPTPLQRLCDLPFRYFSDARSRHILFPTLIAAATGCPKNLTVMGMQINTAMLAEYITSCEAEVAAAEAVDAASAAGDGAGTGTAGGSTRTGSITGGGGGSTAAGSLAGDEPAAIPATEAVLEAAEALPVHYHFASRIPRSMWATAAAQLSGSV